MSDTKYILYMDNLQRMIMGEEIERTPTNIVVKNPLVLHVITEGPKINIQFFPLMFREFMADKDQATLWDVNPALITTCKPVTLDARLISQYKHIFDPARNMTPVGATPVASVPPMTNQNVIKLFDD